MAELPQEVEVKEPSEMMKLIFRARESQLMHDARNDVQLELPFQVCGKCGWRVCICKA